MSTVGVASFGTCATGILIAWTGRPRQRRALACYLVRLPPRDSDTAASRVRTPYRLCHARWLGPDVDRLDSDMG